MQSSAQTFRASLARAQSVRHSKRSSVRCQAVHDVKKAARDAALAASTAALLLLGQPNVAEARLAPPSQFSQSVTTEEELLSIIKSRGTDFSSLEVKKSPKVEPAKEATPEKASAFVLDKSVGVAKVEVVSPLPVPVPVREEESAPAPTPAPVVAAKEEKVEATAPVEVAPTPAPAPVVVAPAPVVVPAAPAAPAAAAEEGSENSNVLILGGLALAAVVGVGALGSQQQQEQAPAVAGSALATPAAPAPAATSSDVPPNVAEARAWIAAWRARTQK